MIMKYMCTAVDGSLKKFLKVYYRCQPHPDNSPKLALKRDYSSVSLLEGFLKIPRPLSCGRGQAARRLRCFLQPPWRAGEGAAGDAIGDPTRVSAAFMSF